MMDSRECPRERISTPASLSLSRLGLPYFDFNNTTYLKDKPTSQYEHMCDCRMSPHLKVAQGLYMFYNEAFAMDVDNLALVLNGRRRLN